MLIKVYDTEGKEHLKESVDARECVAVMGWTLTLPEKKEPDAKAPKAPTAKEMKEFLVAKGVEVPEGIAKAELKALFEANKES